MEKWLSVFLFIMLNAVCRGQDDTTKHINNSGAKRWSLEECIDYAVANNISMNQNKIDLLIAENDLHQAKNNRLPVVSSTINQYHSTGRTIDPITSDFVNQRIGSTNLGVSAAVTLWNGGYLSREIEKKELILEQNRFFIEQAENNIILATIESYIKALSFSESINIARKEVENSISRYRLAKGKFDIGTLSSIDLSKFESQQSSDALLLVNAENDYRAQILNLKQLLEIPVNEPFDIHKIKQIEEEKLVPTTEDLYLSVRNNMPEFKLSRVDLEIRKTDLKIAKTGYYPKLSLRGGLTTGYTSTQQFGFASQLRNNLSPNVSLELTIPIFSQFTNKTNVKNSKIAIKRSELDIKKQDRELYNKIETVVQNFQSAHAQMKAAAAAARSSELAYTLANKKHALGALSLTDLIVTKNEFINNAHKHIQAKLTYTLYQKMIEFYRDRDLTSRKK